MNAKPNDFAGAQQRNIPCLPNCPPFAYPQGDAVRALPAFVEPAETRAPLWREAAAVVDGFYPCGEDHAWWALGVRLALLSLLAFVPLLRLHAAVSEVGPIGMTVRNLARELEFYTHVLPFEVVGLTTSSGEAANDLLGLNDAPTRTAELKLGDERITLTEHLRNKGLPIPPDSHSNDHWFQHIAIVVHDMDLAYERLRQRGVKHISTAPQTLPDWNKDAAGIRAFYFRDPEDHALEIIWFPAGKGNPKWQDSSDRLFLGIDHTAIVVSDTDQSLSFYRDRLGMKVVDRSDNYGTEQEHLNQVFGARLRITALRTGRGPGIEFLEYIAPRGGRPLPVDSKADDLVFWTTTLREDGLDEFLSQARLRGVRFVSTRPTVTKPFGETAAQSVILRDPDGHALRLVGNVAGPLLAK